MKLNLFYRILKFQYLFLGNLLLSLLSCQFLYSQTFTQNNNVTSLIQDFFITGDCASVSNITYTGANGAIGTFSGGGAFGMDNGIIITTGSVANAAGPNNSGSTTTGNGQGTFPPLDAASPGNLGGYDAAYIQFDFVPVTNTISFNYAFASEEYEEYVGSIFNDVFAFFIDGPGINGPYNFGPYTGMANIALLQDNTTPVAINSVNQSTNSQYYVTNTNNSINIEYDGMTTVLTATANVVPCQTYHLILAIQDVGDNAWDSAVFLESGSFEAGQGGVVTAGADGGSANVLEGCIPGYFTFERTPDDDGTQPLVIEFSVGGTATGSDYNLGDLTSPITLAPGVTSLSVPIIATADGISEGSETIEVTILNTACICDGPGEPIELLIFDQFPVDVSISSEVPCVGSATLTATASGALATFGFTYTWESDPPGGPYPSTSTISVSPLIPTTYTVTAFDACGGQSSESILIEPGQSQVAALLPNPPPLCNTVDPINLNDYIDTINGDGGGIWTGSGIVNGNFFDPAGLSGNVDLTYTVGDLACGGDQAILSITITDILTPNLGTPPQICEDGGSVDLSTIDDPAFTGTWSSNGGLITNNIFTPNGFSGSITLTFTPDGECSEPATTSVQIVDFITPNLINPLNFCEGSLTSLNLNDYDDPSVPGTWYAIDPPGIVSGTIVNLAGLSGGVSIGFTPSGTCVEGGQISFSITGQPSLIYTDPICNGNGNLFSFDVTIDGEEGTMYLLEGNATAGANPNFLTTGETATFTLPGNGQAIVLNAYVAGSENCNYEINFMAPLCICPVVDPANGELVFCGDDSELNLALGGNTGIANLEDPGNTLNTDDTDGDGIDWFIAPDPVPGTTENTYAIGDILPGICSTANFTIYAYLRCDSGSDGFTGDANDIYIDAGSVDVTIYPDIANMPIVINENSCCPYVESWECEGVPGWYLDNSYDDLGAIPDCSQEVFTGPISFTVMNINVPIGNPCRIHEYELIYDCRECPELVTPANSTQYFCNIEENANLDPEFIGLEIISGQGVNEYIGFYYDETHNAPFESGNLTAADECTPSNNPIYVFLECDYNSDGNTTYTPAGIVNIVVYPNLANMSYSINTDDPCCPFLETYECEFSFSSADFSITNSIDAASTTNPSCSNFSGTGSFDFTITNTAIPANLAGSECQSVVIPASYTCTACPLPIVITQSYDYCNDSALTLGTVIGENNIQIDYDNPTNLQGLSIHYYLTSGAIPSDEVGDSYALINNDHCNVNTVTVYPYLLCDLNNDGFNGGSDDSYFPAGSIEINLYPDLSQMNYVIESEFGCCPSISQWECDGLPGFSFTNEIDAANDLSPSCASMTNTAGTITWTLANANFPSTCNSAEFEVGFSCLCPTIVPLEFDQSICDNTSPDLSSIDAAIMAAVSDPNNQALGAPTPTVFWYYDQGTYSDLYYDESIAYNSDGCNPQTVVLYAVIKCVLNQEYIEAGQLNITVYPSYDSSNIEPIDNECDQPTYTISCANYTLTPLINNGTIDPGVTNEIASWEVTYPSSPDCFTEVYTITYSCPSPGCPTVIPYNDSFELCDGDEPIFDINALVAISDPLLAESPLLYEDAGHTVLFDGNYGYGGDGCNPHQFTLYIGVTCIQDGSIIGGGNLQITVYPSYNANYMTSTEGSCGTLPTLVASGCNQYVVTAGGDMPSAVTPGLSGTTNFTITYPTDAGNCFSVPYPVDYNCNAIPPVCPEVTTELENAITICDGDIPNYQSYESSVIINDPDNTADGFAWFTNAGLTDNLSNADFVYDGDGCDPTTMTIYLGLLCNIPASQPIYAGQLAITIIPPFSGNNLQEVSESCLPPGLNTTCDNYVIENTSVPLTVGPGSSGTALFTVSFNDPNTDCWTEAIEVDYSCPPAPGCPVVNTPLDESIEVCNGDIPNYTSMESSIIYADPDVNFGGFEWFSDPSFNTPLVDSYFEYAGDNCQPQILTIYVALNCILPNTALIPAGSLDITVYPSYNASLVDDAIGNCAPPSLLPLCDYYNITSTGLPTDVNPGDNGVTNFVVTYNDGGLNCWQQDIPINYSCADPNCPDLITGITESSEFCESAIIDITSFENAIIYEDLENHFDGFVWYADENLSTVIANFEFPYSGDGCDPDEFTIYVGLICDLPNNDPIPAGSLTITIYPPFNSNLVTQTEGDCEPPTLTTTCPNYSIVPTSVPSQVLLGESGSGVFTVSYNDNGEDCWSMPINVAYSCADCTPLNPSLINPEPLCEGDAAFDLNTLLASDATPGGTWSSVTNASLLNGTNLVQSEMSVGEYEFYYTVYPPVGDNPSCEEELASITLVINTPPALDLQNEVTVCNVSEMNSIVSLDELIYDGDNNGVWSLTNGVLPDGVVMPILEFNGTEPGQYTFTYTTESAIDPCENISESVVVTVEDCSVNKYWIPTAFSPNGDGFNDVFSIGGQRISTAELSIYDRWGNKIYYSTQYGQGWDGTYKGDKTEVEVYVYWAKIIFLDGEEVVSQGNITLVR